MTDSSMFVHVITIVRLCAREFKQLKDYARDPVRTALYSGDLNA